MIKYKLLLLYNVYVIRTLVYMFGSHKQYWQHYEKVYMLEKMQKLSSLEKELM